MPLTGWIPLEGWEGPFLMFVRSMILRDYRTMVNASFFGKKRKSIHWSILGVYSPLKSLAIQLIFRILCVCSKYFDTIALIANFKHKYCNLNTFYG